MKTKHRIMIVLIAVLLGIITAGQPVLDASEVKQVEEQKVTGPKRKCYSKSDVEYLMDSNEWSEAKATEVLNLSCDFAVNE